MVRRNLVGGGFLLCTAAMLLVTPVCVLARPRYEVSPQVHVASLTLKGTHGYEIGIYERNGRSLEVSAANFGGSAFAPWVFAEYRIHQRVSGNEIAGALPGVGRVSVRFHPMGDPKREAGLLLPGCTGGSLVKQPGYFKGTIRFRGELGYTTAHATHVHGAVTNHEREVCKRSPGTPSKPHLPKGLVKARLRAVSRFGGRLTKFSVNTFEPLAPMSRDTELHASVEERRRGMRISRYILASGRQVLLLEGSGDFPASATVSPPAPFQGSAVFERGSQGNTSWTGSLRVPLPGAGLVPLTGPGFSASLCQEGGCSG